MDQKRQWIVDRASTSQDLEDIKAIYRANKQQLGLLPDGAFIERLQAKQIVVARLDNAIAGYCLFFINRSREIRIVHLVTNNQSRGTGSARKIVDYMRAEFADFVRMRLNCRSDYVSANIWQRLGFKAVDRKAGKKQGGSELIVYHYRLNDMPLFDDSSSQPDLPLVICDTNVCIDIRYSERERHEAACGLLVDWLQDEISLKVTEEILNDLDRQEEPLRVEMKADVRNNWEQVTPNTHAVEKAREAIRSLLGIPQEADDASDQNHLAIASAAGASVFVTFDKPLLEQAPSILATLGLRVLKPSQLITEIDSVVRANVYQDRELQNSGVERIRVNNSQSIQVEQFIKTSDGENVKQFRSYLDEVLSLPKEHEFCQIADAKSDSMALVIANISTEPMVVIKYLRIAHRLSGTRLGNVLTEYVAANPVTKHSACGDSTVLCIDDSCLSANLAKACLGRGFFSVGRQLWRVVLRGFWTHERLTSKLQELTNQYGLPDTVSENLIRLAEQAQTLGGQEVALKLERLIFPGKLAFGGIETYVVPIRPKWAQELFDYRLWDRPLLNPDTELLVRPDSVYYKRPQNSPPVTGARILWYVSADPKDGGRMIRSCSMMTKGVRGKVKNLFREYERLGVFEWRHLMDHFKSPDADAFAIEFTNTELLPNPIPLDVINSVLVEEGCKGQIFASAVRIPESVFQKVYVQATG